MDCGFSQLRHCLGNVLVCWLPHAPFSVAHPISESAARSSCRPSYRIIGRWAPRLFDTGGGAGDGTIRDADEQTFRLLIQFHVRRGLDERRDSSGKQGFDSC